MAQDTATPGAAPGSSYQTGAQATRNAQQIQQSVDQQRADAAARAQANAINAGGGVAGQQSAHLGSDGVTQYGLFSSSRGPPQGPQQTPQPQLTPGQLTGGSNGSQQQPGQQTQQGTPGTKLPQQPMQTGPIIQPPQVLGAPQTAAPQGQATIGNTPGTKLNVNPNALQGLGPTAIHMAQQQPSPTSPQLVQSGIHVTPPANGGQQMHALNDDGQAPVSPSTPAPPSADGLPVVGPGQARPDGAVRQMPNGDWVDGNMKVIAHGSVATLPADANAPGSSNTGIAGVIGGALGAGMSDFIGAYNAANPNSGRQAESFGPGTPAFQAGSLTGDLSQQATSMVDPAAWEQMARNRLDSANFANLSGLNEGQRRLADSAGRSGLANTGGANAALMQNYQNQGIQSQRDIFNDTLNNQMNAFGQAASFGNTQQGLDQQRWLAMQGLAGQQGMADFNANREDNPSGGALLGDLAQGFGGVIKAGASALAPAALLAAGGGAAAAAV